MLTAEVHDAMPVGRKESTGTFPFYPGALVNTKEVFGVHED